MKLPRTSPTAYLSGFTALNISSLTGRNGDWHFTSAFINPRAKIFVADATPEAFVNTNGILHDEGIVECGDILRASGLPLATWEKVYAADYVRAVIDLLKLTPQQDGETVNLPPDKFVVTFPQIGGMFLKA